jgi:hypothetical protein
VSGTLTYRNANARPTQGTRNDLAVDVLVVGMEGTMDMMNGESAMSSLREKKQEGG